MSNENERFKKMVEDSQDWFWEFDENAIFSYVSPRIRGLLGYEPEELIGVNAFDLMDADEARRVHAYFDPIAKNYLPFKNLVNVNTHKDGRKVVIESSGTPIFDNEGRFRGYRGIDRDITVRSQLEQALDDQNTKLIDILETSTEWIWEIDLSGNHTYTNGALGRFLGYSIAEFSGRNYAEFIHADDLAEVERVLPRYINEKRGWQGWCLRWRHKDGSYRWMESNAKPVLDHSGDVIGFRGADRDVNERKLIEEELRQSEATFKKLFSDSSDAILLIDSTGVFVECNQAALDLLKMTRKQFLLSPPARISPEFQPDGRRSVESAQERIALAHSKGLQRFEWTHVNAEGSEFIVEVSLVPIVIKGQIMLHTTWRDITERKRLENELLHSAEKLKDILNLLSQTIYEADLSGRLTYANQAAFDLFGYSEEDFSAGLNVLDVIIPEDVGRARENIGNLYMGIGEAGNEYTALRKDGTTFPVIIYSSVIKKDGAPFGVRGIIADISKQKKHEQELEKARDLAESMSRAKDEFLANMSHELRTPITAILGFAELLEDTVLLEEQHEYLSHIASSTATLLSLVDDLLDLARIEAGKVYLECVEFSLRKVIGDVANSQNQAARVKGLSFSTQVSADVPDRLMGDPLRLKQVLLNLTVNAIKFTKRGDVRLSVAVEYVHPSTPLLRFDVSDSGIGIKPGAITDIFEPFSQLDPSSTRKYGGAGLGLAICTKLMAIMGGEISVDSCEGVGSTFHVHLPFEVSVIDEECVGTPNQYQAAVTEDTSLRVLLVEDHAVSQHFFAEVLMRCGHHVEVAANGSEALEKIQRRTYDLVLMDVQMPVMDGMEAVGKIRDMEKVGGGHLPVIALTAHAMEKDRIKLLNKGFDGYVSKPTKINVFLDEIKRCLALDN